MSLAGRTLLRAGVALSLVSCGGRSHSSHPAPRGTSSETAAGAGGRSALPAGGAGSGGVTVLGAGGTSGGGTAGVAGQEPIPCSDAPGPVAPPRGAGTLSTHDLTTCVVVEGKVGCFGPGEAGQLGDGLVHPTAMNPRAGEVVWVLDLDDAVEVRVGSGFACARRSTGGVVCWGSSTSGQLGEGIQAPSQVVSAPLPLVGIEDAQGLALGAAHACALLATGSVRCWGNGHYAQLGDGIAHGYPDDQGSAVPVDVLDADGTPLLDVTQVTAGDLHSCALTSDHRVWCWGMGARGQLGDGSFHPGFEGAGVVREVTQVLNLDDAVQISAGTSQTCALRATGRVACWGDNGLVPETANATDVCGTEGAVQVSAGTDHVCALLASGQARCWGYGVPGNLGDGIDYDDFSEGSATPVSVVGLTEISDLAAGARETCAIASGGKVYCWGDGRDGALGTHAVESSDIPLEIDGLEP